ncbi:MAG: hypothetical protein KC620_13010, partial [Myxococcales bacterium]|nr:hypothetical protein [Myxococcales bacterium]
MKHWLAMAGCALVLLTPGRGEAETQGPWSLGLALRPERVAEATGMGGQVHFRYRPLAALTIDGLTRSLVAFGDGDTDDHLAISLGAGAAWTPVADLDAWAPRLGARFTHVHHATLASWEDTPFANLAGDSSGGVRHRSGVEAAVGLMAPRWFDLGDMAGRLDLE